MAARIVFDIQRGALHDGPGIRTTVFLKGCPLRCLWCHNPESIAPEPQLSFRKDLCQQSLACGGIDDKQTARGGPHAVDFSGARPTEAVVAVCPSGALTIIGREMTVDAVMDVVERDRSFYDASGGGLTLSGGEPLFQFEFALELLMRAREAGIHTCLDTSGAVSARRMEATLAFTDLYLFDYKATHPERHRDLTGAANHAILANLDLLYNAGADIILRCPLVPGVNDTAEHLAGIAYLDRKYPRLRAIEVMPYHDLGREKAVRIGREYPLLGVSPADEHASQRWLAALAELGCARATSAS